MSCVRAQAHVKIASITNALTNAKEKLAAKERAAQTEHRAQAARIQPRVAADREDAHHESECQRVASRGHQVIEDERVVHQADEERPLQPEVRRQLPAKQVCGDNIDRRAQ